MPLTQNQVTELQTTVAALKTQTDVLVADDSLEQQILNLTIERDNALAQVVILQGKIANALSALS